MIWSSTYCWKELPLEEVKHQKAQYSGKNLRRPSLRKSSDHLCEKYLAEQGEVDEDGVPEGDGPSLQGAVAGCHRHHHRVDGHQDLGKRRVIAGLKFKL